MIWTDNHPEYETLNPQLEEWVRFLPEMEEDGDGYTNLRVTKRTSYHEYPKIFRELAEWVMNTDQFSLSFPEFKVEIWGAIYNKGDYAVPHTHGDGEIVSFVYYVNCLVIPSKFLALMGFSRTLPSSLDLLNFVVQECRKKGF